MEATGVTLDTAALRESSEILSAQLRDIEQEIYQYAGREFNLNSPRQIGEVFFEEMKLDEKARKPRPVATAPAKRSWKNSAASIRSWASSWSIAV